MELGSSKGASGHSLSEHGNFCLEPSKKTDVILEKVRNFFLVTVGLLINTWAWGTESRDRAFRPCPPTADSTGAAGDSKKTPHSLAVAFAYYGGIGGKGLAGAVVDEHSNIPKANFNLFGIPGERQTSIDDSAILLAQYDSVPPIIGKIAGCLAELGTEGSAKPDAPPFDDVNTLPYLVECTEEPSLLPELRKIRGMAFNEDVSQLLKSISSRFLELLPPPVRSAKDAFKLLIQKKRNELGPNETLRVAEYSGHGSVCAVAGSPKIRRWCGFIPSFFSQVSKTRWSQAEDFLLPSGKAPGIGYEIFTDDEWFEMTEAPINLIDSCHAGAAVASMKRLQKGAKNGIMAIVTSLDGQLADDTKTGGRLFQFLAELSSKPAPLSCSLDLDRDGQISERELGAVVFQKFWQAGGNPFETASLELAIRESKKVTATALASQLAGEVDLPASVVSDRCALGLPSSCPRATTDPQATACANLRSRVARLASGLTRLTGPVSPAPKKSTLSARPRSPQGEDNNLPAGPHGNVGWVIDARKMEATTFLRQWALELSSKSALCSKAPEASNACSIPPLSSSLDTIHRWTQDLTAIIRYEKRE